MPPAFRGKCKVENLWSLVRDREQAELELPTARPVEDFDTGFLGASIEEVGTFFKERYDKAAIAWEKPICVMSRKTFVVLDERGLRENNVVVAHWWLKEDDDDKRTDEIVHEDDPNVFGWKTFRVPFCFAAELAQSIDEADFEIIDDSRDEPGQCLTEDGIFILAGEKKKYAELGLYVRKD